MTVSNNLNKALTLDLKSWGEEIKKVDKCRYLGSTSGFAASARRNSRFATVALHI